MLLMWLRENPNVSLKIKYRKTLELAFLTALSLLTLAFIIFPKFINPTQIITTAEVKIEVQDIPQTQQIKRPPPPARPLIPIASEEDDILDDVTIEDTDIDFSDLPPPPAPPSDEGEEPIFITWDEPPKPVGGMAALLRNLKYPEIALKAGVTGTVVIQAVIDESGNILETSILKSLGNNGTTEAAISAIRSVKWTPAKQRDRPVKVRIAIPVTFKLQ